jgi:uncharacterized protein (DUF4415 family)
MENEERIVSYTAVELAEKRRRGETKTDWAYLDSLTDEELEASIDFEDEGEFDWDNAFVGLPGPKRQITVRLDQDLIDWFKQQGRGYQTRMNAVLRSYVDAQKRAALTKR